MQNNQMENNEKVWLTIITGGNHIDLCMNYKAAKDINDYWSAGNYVKQRVIYTEIGSVLVSEVIGMYIRKFDNSFYEHYQLANQNLKQYLREKQRDEEWRQTGEDE